jgi:hypothetical protein
MDSEIVPWPFSFQYLIDSKHPFARSLDASSKSMATVLARATWKKVMAVYNSSKGDFNKGIDLLAERLVTVASDTASKVAARVKDQAEAAPMPPTFAEISY